MCRRGPRPPPNPPTPGVGRVGRMGARPLQAPVYIHPYIQTLAPGSAVMAHAPLPIRRPRGSGVWGGRGLVSYPPSEATRCRRKGSEAGVSATRSRQGAASTTRARRLCAESVVSCTQLPQQLPYTVGASTTTPTTTPTTTLYCWGVSGAAECNPKPPTHTYPNNYPILLAS